MTADESKSLQSLLKARDGNFRFECNNKKELGTLSDVSSGEFLLVETFPPEVLSKLNSSAQNKMHLAIIAVCLALLVYAVITFLIGRRARRRLENENKKVSKQLRGAEGLANHDELTGLYNRRDMSERIATLDIERKQRALLLLDIDYFNKSTTNMVTKQVMFY